MAGAFHDETIARAWDPSSGLEQLRLDGRGSSVRSVAELADGRIVSASWSNTVSIWDPESGRQDLRLEVHNRHHLAATIGGHKDCLIALLVDGCIVSRSNDNTVRVWDATHWKEMSRLTPDASPTEFGSHG